VAGIAPIRFHDLRHSYASLLMAKRENVKYIQAQLRHSSPTVILNVYSHLLKETNQEAVCLLENTIFQATGHKRKKGAGREWLTTCFLAGRRGFEPRFTESESVVLPLNDPPADVKPSYHRGNRLSTGKLVEGEEKCRQDHAISDR
jgi:hypothetical protein